MIITARHFILRRKQWTLALIFLNVKQQSRSALITRHLSSFATGARGPLAFWPRFAQLLSSHGVVVHVTHARASE